MRFRRMRGFSLIEMMITVTIILIVSGVAFLGIQPALRASRVNAGYNITLGAIRQARDYAVAQRQQYSITFSNAAVPNTIVITQTGNGNVVDTYTLPTDVTFNTPPGIPVAPSTPDGFGAGATAIDFDQAIAGGIKTTIYFLPDGSGQDVAGNINNGVIYVARSNGELFSSHAITFWGATGRIRGWKLAQNGGPVYWKEN